MKKSYFNKLTGAAAISAMLFIIPSTASAWQCTEGSVSGNNVQQRSGSAPGHSSSRYSSEIQKTKLQIGDDSDTCFDEGRSIGNVNAFNDHFWLSSSGQTVFFEESGDSFRSELREEREFTVDDSGNDYVRTRARVIRRSGGIEEVTIAQLHSENSRGPVARLNWADSGVNTDVNGNSPEGIWLSIRQSPTCRGGNSCFSHSYIGNIEGSYRTYRLGLWGNRLRLSINGNFVDLVHEDIFDNDNDGNLSERKTSNSINLNNTDWDGQRLYLKLGAYINSSGSSRVGHRNIRFF